MRHRVLKDYYKQEMHLLKDIAADFSRENPSLSRTMFGSQADPDAARILEGVAFLTANIRQELDSQFPKLLHSLAQQVCPQYIRPLPAATIMAFEPRASLTQALPIPAGTYIDSTESENGVCRFKTTDQVELLPLKLDRVVEQEESADDEYSFTLHFELINQTLDQLEFNKLRIHLAGEYSDASDLYFMLCHQLASASIASEGEVSLQAGNVKGTGFNPKQSLFPQPKGMMPAYDLLQQYFLFPQKYMFVDVDLSSWKTRGSGNTFAITFNCAKPNFRLPKLSTEHFVLYATPAVNLFEQESQSVLISAKTDEYQLLPTGMSGGSEQQIYSIDNVESIARGMSEPRAYQSFGGFYDPNSEKTIYEVSYRPGSKPSAPELFLKLAFPQGQAVAEKEILQAKLTCSNGDQAENLAVGEICVATSNTPELATFRNITAPTSARRIPLDGKMLWQLVSHLSLNYLSITDADTLKAILRQYVAPDEKDKTGRLINDKKIEAITNVTVQAGESLFGNAFIRGQNIRIQLKSENFTSKGDKYLFGSVMEQFLVGTAAINVYSELTLEDFFSGECLEWPAKIGNRPLQ